MTQDTATFLAEKGFLTVNQFVQHLRQHHPIKSVAYPTMMRYVGLGMVPAIKLGGQYRIPKSGIEYYIEHGTLPKQLPELPPPPTDQLINERRPDE